MRISANLYCSLRYFKFAFLFGCALFIAAGSVGLSWADDRPSLTFPVRCTLGQDCWIANYVDIGAGDDAQDFMCQSRTSDAHKGVDIAVSSLHDIRAGVDVVSVLDGKVLRIRDGESDTIKSSEDLEVIKEQQKECGNAVLIDHGKAGFPGLQSLYCHLKNKSVLVSPGENVKAGQKIAQIGHSGLTEFPHLHYGLTWENGIIDPFTGKTIPHTCQKEATPWWESADIRHQGTQIFAFGFRGKLPDFQAIHRGERNPDVILSSADSLAFWVGLYALQKGDEVTLEIFDPDGRLFIQRTMVQDKSRARQYYYTGRKNTRHGFKKGIYKGQISLKSDTHDIVRKTLHIEVK